LRVDESHHEARALTMYLLKRHTRPSVGGVGFVWIRCRTPVIVIPGASEGLPGELLQRQRCAIRRRDPIYSLKTKPSMNVVEARDGGKTR
jgi:hypothetical protein